MPACKNITITLQSQYDALLISERALANTQSEAHPHSAASVLIPNHLGSQFWICYSCPPPLNDTETRCYFFKLFLLSGTGEREQCVLSWGAGTREGWDGKVVFGLFEGLEDFDGRSGVEKKGFFFPTFTESGDQRGLFSIEVFQAKGKRREGVIFESVPVRETEDGGVRLNSIGHLKKYEPKGRYTYALINALDEPFATFNYHLEPPDFPLHRSDSRGQSGALAESNLEQRSSPAFGDDPLQRRQRDADPVKQTSLGRRLSIAPRRQLFPDNDGYGTYVAPSKQANFTISDSDKWDRRSENNSYEDCFTRDDWRIETPSPVQLGRSITPPSTGRRSGSATLLRGVIAHAMRRKE